VGATVVVMMVNWVVAGGGGLGGGGWWSKEGTSSSLKASTIFWKERLDSLSLVSKGFILRQMPMRSW
jgi:hypothetical protein